jgi:homoserine dehydrogenase
MHEHRQIKLVIVGLGNIGRRFLQILEKKSEHLLKQYGLTFQVVGAADSRGAALSPDELDLTQVVALKEQKRSVAEYPGRGRPGMTPLDVVRQVDADALCEASPVDLETGEPGLSCIRAALDKGMHVVTPNKGPLVLAYRELHRLAREKGVRLLFCGTVAGGLPAINLGRRDLAGATIHRLEALPNLTTSFILDRMARGKTYAEALAAAQAQGCAEADPSLDVEGWDAANKLVILANSVLGIPATLGDVDVQGITAVTQADLQAASAQGQTIKLVASAVRQEDGGYALTVAPTPLPNAHPLARLSGQQMGLVFHTDIYGVISAAILEEDPTPSAATILRDLLSIYGTTDEHGSESSSL